MNNNRYHELIECGYIQHALNEEAGTYIVSHPEHVIHTSKKNGAIELEKNIKQAYYYFRKGQSVELLKAFNNDPSLDARIGNLVYEFETVTKNKASTIQGAIREASEQVTRYTKKNNYLLDYNISIMLRVETVDAINIVKGINYALHHNYKIDRLDIALPNDELLQFTLIDLKKGLYNSVVKEALKKGALLP